MSTEPPLKSSISLMRLVQVALLAWVAIIGIDFLLHGGLFASVYEQKSLFLLSAEDAFRRIPLGYLALLATVGLLTWILVQASVQGWRKGLVLGLALGAVMGAISTLALYSISTVSLQMLGVWFVAQVVEFAVAGALIGQGLDVESLRRLSAIVVVGFILLFVATVAIQNLG